MVEQSNGQLRSSSSTAKIGESDAGVVPILSCRSSNVIFWSLWVAFLNKVDFLNNNGRLF